MSVSTLTKSEILVAVAEGTMTVEEASEHLVAMVTPQPLRLKVSPKGGVSIYGMGRFPITLYSDQWIRILDFGDEIRAFIDANRDQLTWKNKKRLSEDRVAETANEAPIH